MDTRCVLLSYGTFENSCCLALTIVLSYAFEPGSRLSDVAVTACALFSLARVETGGGVCDLESQMLSSQVQIG